MGSCTWASTGWSTPTGTTTGASVAAFVASVLIAIETKLSSSLLLLLLLLLLSFFLIFILCVCAPTPLSSPPPLEVSLARVLPRNKYHVRTLLLLPLLRDILIFVAAAALASVPI